MDAGVVHGNKDTFELGRKLSSRSGLPITRVWALHFHDEARECSQSVE